MNQAKYFELGLVKQDVISLNDTYNLLQLTDISPYLRNVSKQANKN